MEYWIIKIFGKTGFAGSTLNIEDVLRQRRLQYKLGLTTKDKNFDYRYAVKFLENAYSLGTNLAFARYHNIEDIVKLLEDNGVKAAPNDLLIEVHMDLYELEELSKRQYKEFKKSVKDFIDPDEIVHTGSLIFYFPKNIFDV
jgi:hypothetical protein